MQLVVFWVFGLGLEFCGFWLCLCLHGLFAYWFYCLVGGCGLFVGLVVCLLGVYTFDCSVNSVGICDTVVFVIVGLLIVFDAV